jgi:hypothetical protein
VDTNVLPANSNSIEITLLLRTLLISVIKPWAHKMNI